MSDIRHLDPGKNETFPFVTVPGIGNSGPDHWQTWLEEILGDVRRIDVPDWHNPELSKWLDGIDGVVMNEWRPAVLVAHSFGALAAAQYALEEPTKIAGILLVAPADPARFADGAKLSLAPVSCAGMLISSRNDPWMEARIAQRWAQIWGVKLVDEGEAGHINVASGHGPWPGLLNHLSRLTYEARSRVQGRHGLIYLNGEEVGRRSGAAGG